MIEIDGKEWGGATKNNREPGGLSTRGPKGWEAPESHFYRVCVRGSVCPI